MTTNVRRVRVGDEAAWKSTRLRALLDSPTAFARTHDEEAAYPDELWQARIEMGAASESTASFLAFDEAGEPVGMVAIFRPDDQPEITPDLVSMWVAPEWRGSDVARRLVDAALDWARSVGDDRVELWVTRGNDRAKAFYERLGFVVTGEFAPLPSDPCIDEIRMRYDVRDQAHDEEDPEDI